MPHKKKLRFPRLKVKPPRWWDTYATQRQTANQDLRFYTWIFDNAVAPDTSYHADNASTASGRIIITHNRQQYRKFRALSRDSLSITNLFETVVIYLGRKVFVRLDKGMSVFERRSLFHNAHDIYALFAHTNSFLCHQSACRYYNAPLLFSTPTVHLGRCSAHTIGTPRPIPPKQGFGTSMQTHWHKKHKYCHVITRGDIRVTSIQQTLLDVLASASEPDFIVPADYLLRLFLKIPQRCRSVSPSVIRSARETIMAMAHREAGAYNCEKIARRFDMLSPLSESPLESLVRFACLTAGLQMPIVQHRVEAPDSSQTFYVDMYWPDFGLAIEVDGLEKYKSTSDLRKEKNRENKLYATIPYVKRITWDTMKSWQEFISVLSSGYAR